MSVFDQLERRLLFALTRGMALVLVFSALAVAVAALMQALHTDAETGVVTYEDIRARIAPHQESTGSQRAVLTSRRRSVELPRNVRRYLQPEDDSVIEEWVRDLTDEERIEFVQNLSTVVARAEEAGERELVPIINEYKDAKVAAMRARAAGRSKAQLQRIESVGVAIGALGLLGLFSLTLVLLAIERNTRPVASRQHVRPAD